MYKLTPLTHVVVDNLFHHVNLPELVEQYGSPLNILIPEPMEENIAAFQSCLDSYDLQSTICYAHKPNKSLIFPALAQKTGINIDVASFTELNNAISLGFLPQQIEATGPKNAAFLEACIRKGVIMNVDSLRELETIGTLSKSLNITTSILVRLSNFSSTSIAIKSKLERFGVEYAQLDMVWDLLSKFPNTVILRGFSFHINTNSLPERLVAVEQVITATLQGQQRGHDQCTVVDIGGGFQANFIKNKDEWDDYLIQLKEYARGAHPERLSFTGTAFGYQYDGKAVKGSYTFQDFYNPNPKTQFLKKILEHRLPTFENRPVRTVIAENLLELWIEPGQGLLDQCGITLARIIDVKQVQGEQIIVAEMNYTNLDSDRYELFTDPILIPAARSSHTIVSQSNPSGYFISGDLCLSIDLIANHKVYFDTTPKPGDVLVFINTAAYRMDFVESQPLQHPIAKKIVHYNSKVYSESEFVSHISNSPNTHGSI